MANEITMSASFAVSKGGASISTGSMSKTSDMTGADMQTSTQTIGTSNEALSFNTTDITGDVIVAVKNLDSTNYVEIFSDNGNANRMAKLKAGQFALLPNVDSTKLYGRANTAAVQVQFWISEE